MINNIVYMRLGEALEFYEKFVDFWAGVNDKPPTKPPWMGKVSANAIRRTTQRIVNDATINEG